MIEHLTESGVETEVINTVPSRFAKIFDGAAWKVLRALLVVKIFFGILTRRDLNSSAVYTGISGGAGLLFDCVLALAFRRLNVPVYLHHHSFAYVRLRSKPFVWLCRILSNVQVTHIVLCSEMGELLNETYPESVRNEQLFVLSNSAFFAGVAERERLCEREGHLTLGYLANITADKGVLDVISLFESCIRAGLPVRMKVAGPCQDDSIRARLSKLAEDSDGFDYLGAVYDREKLNFFEAIDLMVFPTRYANEAEPLVIYEAAEHGVPTLSNARGCIASMVERCGGWVADSEDSFVDNAFVEISSLLQSGGLAERRAQAIEGSEFLRGGSRAALANLVSRMGGAHGSKA